MADENASKQAVHCENMGSDEYFQHIVTLIQPSLEKKLTASHLVCYLPLIKEVTKIVSSIHAQENSGDFPGAAKALLEAVKNAQVPGKWRMFVDALRETEHTAALSMVLLEELNAGPISGSLADLQHSGLIEIFADTVGKHLNLDKLLPKFLEKGLVDKQDMARLRAEIDGGNAWSANITFLLLVHRRLKDWYEVLMNTLFEDEHHKLLVKEIDPTIYEKLEQKHETTEDQSLQSAREAAESQNDPVSPDHDHSTNGYPFSQEDVGYTAHSHAASKSVEVGAGEAAGSNTALCGCGCCQQVKTELSTLRAQVASLASELRDMKDQLMEAIKTK